jgi:hypothetical protein
MIESFLSCARHLVVVVDHSKPRVGEFAREPDLRGLHDVQRGGGVVQDGVDEDLEVRKAKRDGLGLSSWLIMRALTTIGRRVCNEWWSERQR